MSLELIYYIGCIVFGILAILVSHFYSKVFGDFFFGSLFLLLLVYIWHVVLCFVLIVGCFWCIYKGLNWIFKKH